MADVANSPLVEEGTVAVELEAEAEDTQITRGREQRDVKRHVQFVWFAEGFSHLRRLAWFEPTAQSAAAAPALEPPPSLRPRCTASPI